MEVFQREHIRQNLSALIANTNCNVSFISHLVSKGILADYDVESLRVIEHRYEKAAKFYEIVVDIENSYHVIQEAFKETCQTGADVIFSQLTRRSSAASCSALSSANHPDLESRTRKRIRYEVRSPVHLFTGRDDEISLLHKHMTCQEGDTKCTAFVPNTTIVTGLGGIGKTELCRKYIEMYSEYYDGNVIWIQAEREADLTRDFKIVAKDHLKISLNNVDGSEKDIKTVVDEVYKYFIRKRALFVFDNAVRNADEHLDIFLPTRVKIKPAIIITSRDRDFMPSRILIIGELKEVEAAEFVKKGLKTDISQDYVVKKLVKRLQYFPLAIQQAVSFIKERGNLRTFEIEEYLSLFESNTKQLLNSKKKGVIFATNNYSMTTYTTWKITTDLIASEEEFGELSIKFLNMMSYFEPDRIPIGLFSKCDDTHNDSSFETESALQLLIKYSMINSQPLEKMLNIHRLVQEVTRIDLKADNREEQVLQFCLSIFVSEVDWNALGHAKSVLEFCPCYTSLVKQFPSVPCNVGEKLMDVHNKDFSPFCKKWHKILTEVLSEGEVEIIHMEFYLAKQLYEEKCYDECLEAFSLIFAKYMSIQTPVELMLWRTQRFVAGTLKFLRKYEESLEVATTVFKEQVVLPEMDLTELVFTATIAFTGYMKLENYKGALEWCETILDLVYPGKYQPNAPNLFNNLRRNDMKTFYLREIANRVTTLLELDVAGWTQLAITLTNILGELRFDSEALQLAITMLNIAKEKYGGADPTVHFALLTIAMRKTNVGEYEEALAIFQKPELAVATLEYDFVTGMKLMSRAYARALSRTGAHDEALQKLFEILDSVKERHGPEHEYVAQILFDIGSVYADMQRFEDTVRILKDAQKLLKKLKYVDPAVLVTCQRGIDTFTQILNNTL